MGIVKEIGKSRMGEAVTAISTIPLRIGQVNRCRNSTKFSLKYSKTA